MTPGSAKAWKAFAGKSSKSGASPGRWPPTPPPRSSLQEGRGPFDLLLLDIQMAGINGMEFAKTLRDRGDEVRILFITGAAEYALEGYQVNPIHYLLKPVNQRDLERVLVGDWERNH